MLWGDWNVCTFELLCFFIGKEVVFRKPTRPSLPLRKAPPLTPALSPQERGRKPPSGARNRFALRLADHQRSAPCCAGWDRLDASGNIFYVLDFGGVSEKSGVFRNIDVYNGDDVCNA